MSPMKRNRINIRLEDETLKQLDDWRKRQEFPLTRSAAIRLALKRAFSYSVRVREASK